MNASSDANRWILLTPGGSGAIAVVRLRGEGVLPFLEKYFSKPVAPGKCVHGELRDERGVIDDPVAVLGEGFVDLNLHGGPWIAQEVGRLAESQGFVRAETDSEDVIWEILGHAPTRKSTLAMAKRWGEWKTEGGEFFNDRGLWFMSHPPRVAIVGEPNAGKSTLANRLYGVERSITADLPGTTRDWVGELADLDGFAVWLLDTPGLRETSDPIEREAINKSLREIENADLTIVVKDATADWAAQIELEKRWKNTMGVWNKIDAVEKKPEGLGVSAKENWGLTELKRAIGEYFQVRKFCDEARRAENGGRD